MWWDGKSSVRIGTSCRHKAVDRRVGLAPALQLRNDDGVRGRCYSCDGIWITESGSSYFKNFEFTKSKVKYIKST